MNSIFTKVAGFAAAVALMATPAWAAQPEDNPGNHDHPNSDNHPSHSNRGGNHDSTPGPRAGMPEKAKAYGRYCKGQSKKRSDAAPGTKGTPFSQCVRAMAHVANDENENPKKACKALSKKRRDAAPGTKGTPFSQCIHAANELRRDQREQEAEESGQ
jgi:hypothetical protein